MIMIHGPSPSAILTTLQNTLQTIEDWCKEHRLEISKEKLAMMPTFIRKREEYKCHPTIVAWGIKVVSKMRYLGIIVDCKLGWYPPHTISRKQVTAYSQQPCPPLPSHLGHVIPQPNDCL
jgi:hypothetical protein